MHGEVAVWLEAQACEPARIAKHWLAAGSDLQAVPHLSAAAVRLHEAWQSEQAALLSAQAGQILLASGRHTAAFSAYLKAAEMLSTLRMDHRLDEWATLLEQLAETDWHMAALGCLKASMLASRRQLNEAHRVTLQSLALARRSAAFDLEVELLWILTALAWERRDLRQALEYAQTGLERVADVDVKTSTLDLNDTRFKLLHARGTILTSLGQYDQGDAGLEAAFYASVSTYRTGIAPMLASSAMEQGDASRARAWVDQALEWDDRETSNQNTRVNALSACAWVLACCGELGLALTAMERVARMCEQGDVRNRVGAMLRYGDLMRGLGRRDLAVKTWKTLLARTDLQAPEILRTQSALLGEGERLEVRPILEGISGIEDIPLRTQTLAQARPGCMTSDILPLLNTTAATAKDRGAHGLWLTLQTHRIAALREAHRASEARDAAMLAWQRINDGTTATEMFHFVGAQLCAAVLPFDRELAERMSLTSMAWMQKAATTLPAQWRDNFLTRSPAILALPLRPLV